MLIDKFIVDSSNCRRYANLWVRYFLTLGLTVAELTIYRIILLSPVKD